MAGPSEEQIGLSFGGQCEWNILKKVSGDLKIIISHPAVT